MKARLRKAEKFVTDANGKRTAVLLDVKTYHRLREAGEELAEVIAYDAARSTVQSEVAAGQTISLAEYRARRASIP